MPSHRGRGTPAELTRRRAKSEQQVMSHKKNRKRARVRLSNNQLAVMERIFWKNQYPNAEVCTTLSSMMNVPQHSVQIWFQNRRAKYRRQITALHKMRAQGTAPVDSLPELCPPRSARANPTNAPTLQTLPDGSINLNAILEGPPSAHSSDLTHAFQKLVNADPSFRVTMESDYEVASPAALLLRASDAARVAEGSVPGVPPDVAHAAAATPAGAAPGVSMDVAPGAANVSATIQMMAARLQQQQAQIEAQQRQLQRVHAARLGASDSSSETGSLVGMEHGVPSYDAMWLMQQRAHPQISQMPAPYAAGIANPGELARPSDGLHAPIERRTASNASGGSSASSDIRYYTPHAGYPADPHHPANPFAVHVPTTEPAATPGANALAPLLEQEEETILAQLRRVQFLKHQMALQTGTATDMTPMFTASNAPPPATAQTQPQVPIPGGPPPPIPERNAFAEPQRSALPAAPALAPVAAAADAGADTGSIPFDMLVQRVMDKRAQMHNGPLKPGGDSTEMAIASPMGRMTTPMVTRMGTVQPQPYPHPHPAIGSRQSSGLSSIGSEEMPIYARGATPATALASDFSAMDVSDSKPAPYHPPAMVPPRRTRPPPQHSLQNQDMQIERGYDFYAQPPQLPVASDEAITNMTTIPQDNQWLDDMSFLNLFV